MGACSALGMWYTDALSKESRGDLCQCDVTFVCRLVLGPLGDILHACLQCVCRAVLPFSKLNNFFLDTLIQKIYCLDNENN